jgi:formylglycine-generating enzyme required for sulfatase activity
MPHDLLPTSLSKGSLGENYLRQQGEQSKIFLDAMRSSSPYSNPQGPIYGEQRSLRGANWDSAQIVVYTSTYLRLFYEPSSSGNMTGFRCARSP